MNEYSEATSALKMTIQKKKPMDVSLRGRPPIVHEICYGTLRHYFFYSNILGKLLNKPLKKKHFDLQLLLKAALYSLDHLNRPVHSSVNNCVIAAKYLGKVWAKELINAILREYIRNKEVLCQAVMNNSIESETNHPLWLAEAIKADWDNWENIIRANNAKGPMTLRVNKKKISRKAYQELLDEKGIKFNSGAFSTNAITLQEPRNVETIPGFREGLISVQDEAAQVAVELLNLRPHLRILDACAAPGGKTCHILESEPKVELTALDLNGERAKKITENLDRLSLNATVIISPLEKFESEYKFDRILVDAPCSATGVIRRHPDIKILRKEDDVDKLASQQKLLLQKAFELLGNEGELLYSTCSILKRENDLVVRNFIGNTPYAEINRIPDFWSDKLSSAVRTEMGIQFFPTEQNHDGFYYASISRKTI
ncbi:MAG: hypothetical protein CMQ40_05990 [Gammaproteobacteria bacterium]|nr:hypothetical protein [Gammaproteobacteria bacterium]|tara:strand:+ start:217 stop:1500 length:1284 start_codon:yes stop_codon:yes gene_type:complete